MSNRPVVHSEAELERDKLVSTNRPVPFQFSRIVPKQAGAVARVDFTLNHWFRIDNHPTRCSSQSSFASYAFQKAQDPRRVPGDESLLTIKRANKY